jgi:hypothetical protein
MSSDYGDLTRHIDWPPLVRELSRRVRLYTDVIDALRRRDDENTVLLNSALHELATARGLEPQQFIDSWLREHRRLDSEGVPLERVKPRWRNKKMK